MPCTVVNSQSQIQARLPVLTGPMPQNQADWTAFTNQLRQWAQALQQENYAPNVLPAQFQTFQAAASKPVLAALTASNCTPAIDNTTQYYGTASLKVSGITSGATLRFTGTPIAIQGGTRWFCSFQIDAPSGCTGSLEVLTSGGHSVTDTFVVPASANWQQVWGLFDLTAFPDPQATWIFTFTSTANVNLDGLQMNAVGKPLAFLPQFAGTQMVVGGLAYGSTTDDVPPGTSPIVATTLAVIGAQRNHVPDSGLKCPTVFWADHSAGLITITQDYDGANNCFQYTGTGAASGTRYRNCAQIPVNPSASYVVSAVVDGANITSGTAFVGIYDPTVTTNYGSFSIGPSSVGRLSAAVSIPLGVTRVTLVFSTNNCTVANGTALIAQEFQLEAGTVMTVYQESIGDSLSGSYLIDFANSNHASKNVDNVPDGTTYGRYHLSGMTGNLADPSKGGLAAKGSTPPMLLGCAFSWTSTSGQVTITWPAFTIYRADGTTTSVAAGSGTTVTGLTNGTTYTVYPYVVDGATVVSFATGATGAVGTPAMCYPGGSAAAAADMYLNANIPLQNFTVTPASGGGGGGGNANGCLHEDTQVELADGRSTPARCISGKVLKGPVGPTEVVNVQRGIRNEWVRVGFSNNKSAMVTRDHKFLAPDDMIVRAEDLTLGAILAGDGEHVEVTYLELVRERALMISINVEYPHLYYLAGALSHNGNPKP